MNLNYETKEDVIGKDSSVHESFQPLVTALGATCPRFSTDLCLLIASYATPLCYRETGSWDNLSLFRTQYMVKHDYTLPSSCVSDMTFKWIMMGDSAVGKTTLLNKWLKKDQIDLTKHFRAIGGEFLKTTLSIEKSRVSKFVQSSLDCSNTKTIANITIWDSSDDSKGQEFIPGYYRTCQGFLLVFDVYNVQSFDVLEYYMSIVQQHCHESTRIVILGNHILPKNGERQVSFETAQDFATKCNCPYFEVDSELDSEDSNGIHWPLAMLAAECMQIHYSERMA